MLTSAIVWRWTRRLSFEFTDEASSTASTCAVRIEDRRAGAGQADVVAAEMFFAMHGHRAAFGKAGADAVGAFVAFVPECAEPQSGLAEFALQGRIGDRAHHRALRVGQNHGEARAGDLLVQAFHFGARHAQQFAHALLRFADRLRIEHRILARGSTARCRIPCTQRCHERVTCGSMPAGLQSALNDVKDA